MPQPVTAPKPPFAPQKPSTPYAGVLGLYLLLALAPIALKLLHLTRAATWSWAAVTAVLWVPWAVLCVLVALGWVLHWLGRRG